MCEQAIYDMVREGYEVRVVNTKLTAPYVVTV